MRTISTHPFALFVIVACFCIGMIASAAAISSALFRVRTTDAFFSALLCANDIEYRRTDNQHDRGNCNVINESHNYAFRAYSALSCLFFLMIITVKTAAIAMVMAQPRIGIQTAPRLPPVRSVPKKNTRNAIT